MPGFDHPILLAPREVCLCLEGDKHAKPTTTSHRIPGPFTWPPQAATALHPTLHILRFVVSSDRQAGPIMLSTAT